MRGLARVRGALGALLVASLAAAGVSAVGTADRASAAEESDGKPRQLYAGGPAVYLVDHAGGTVQALDPVSLAPRGRQYDLRHPIGRPVVDPEGTLWAPLDEAGAVMPVRAEGAGPAVEVAAPGSRLWLTLVSGRLTVLDPIGQSLAGVSTAGVEYRINLPDEIRQGDLDQLLVPAWTEGSFVPVLAADQNRLFVLDVDSKSGLFDSDLGLGGSDLLEPQAVGRVVVIPQPSVAGTSRRLVYIDGRTFQQEFLNVPGKPGPIPVMVRQGRVWSDFTHGAGEL